MMKTWIKGKIIIKLSESMLDCTCKELVESLTVVGTHQTEGEVWQDKLHGGGECLQRLARQLPLTFGQTARDSVSRRANEIPVAYRSTHSEQRLA